MLAILSKSVKPFSDMVVDKLRTPDSVATLTSQSSKN